MCFHFRHLALSTNNIEKISNLAGLDRRVHHPELPVQALSELSRRGNSLSGHLPRLAHGALWVGPLAPVSFTSLRTLSLSRNLIKRIEGLDPVAETLEARTPTALRSCPTVEYGFYLTPSPLHRPNRSDPPALPVHHLRCLPQELWLSYNQIAQLSGLEKCGKLRVLYVSNNKIADYKALEVLTPLTSLEELVLLGNPLYDAAKAEGPPTALCCSYRIEVRRRNECVGREWMV